MVEQKLCPNCGSEMDLSNVFISGKANCPVCGYVGLPVSKAQNVQKVRKIAKMEPQEEAKETPDLFDLKGLSLKLAIVFCGLLVLSVATPTFGPLTPVAGAGIVMFGAAYLILSRR